MPFETVAAQDNYGGFGGGFGYGGYNRDPDGGCGICECICTVICVAVLTGVILTGMGIQNLSAATVDSRGDSIDSCVELLCGPAAPVQPHAVARPPSLLHTPLGRRSCAGSMRRWMRGRARNPSRRRRPG